MRLKTTVEWSLRLYGFKDSIEMHFCFLLFDRHTERTVRVDRGSVKFQSIREYYRNLNFFVSCMSPFYFSSHRNSIRIHWPCGVHKHTADRTDNVGIHTHTHCSHDYTCSIPDSSQRLVFVYTFKMRIIITKSEHTHEFTNEPSDLLLSCSRYVPIWLAHLQCVNESAAIRENNFSLSRSLKLNERSMLLSEFMKICGQTCFAQLDDVRFRQSARQFKSNKQSMQSARFPLLIAILFVSFVF